MKLLLDCFIVLVILFGPRLMVLLSNRVKPLGILGPVFLCYACGFLLSLVLPDTSLAMDISEILVPIAIPLILFSADLRSVKRLAKPTLISFGLLTLAVIAVAGASYFVFRNAIPDAYKYAGMMTGLYTGGTPNLMAIGVALGLEDSYIVLANASDVVVGGVYFLLLVSVLPGLTRRFLKPFDPALAGSDKLDENALSGAIQASFVPEKERFSVKNLLSRAPILLLGALCLALAAGLALLTTGELNVVVIMLAVTTLGIGLSFVKKVREAPGSYAAGQYLILMFSFGIGLSFDFGEVTAQSLLFLLMFAMVTFGSALLHTLLCRLFKIDADTALTTSTAGIFGPAFIPAAAKALNNEAMVLPGLICGILGYAIGNYLGIGTALLLKMIGG